LERSMLDIAQTGAVLVSRTGPGPYLTGTVSAYCFDIHTRRASRTTRLSAPEHHRYVRVLDWKVARELEHNAAVGGSPARKLIRGKVDKTSKFLF
jgi:hypothetical protein